MSKVDKIDAKVKKHNEDLSTIREEVKVLPEQIQAARARADAAVEGDDFSVYSAAIAERDRLQQKLDYMKSRAELLASGTGVSLDEVKDAWSDYRKDYDPRLKKKLAEYQGAIEKALSLYGELIKLQTESSEIRSRFCSYTGVGAESALLTFPAEMIPLLTYDPNGQFVGFTKLAGSATQDPDAVRYLSHYIRSRAKDIADPEVQRINRILTTGRV